MVYAYCRMLDDTADDESVPKALRLEALEARRQEIKTGIATDELGAIFLHVISGCDHSRTAILDLIEGVVLDLDEPILKSQAELEQYCYLVAGTVGVLMCKVLGVDLNNPKAKRAAISLGQAMQLTNILRDIKEDFELRGRVYLPNLVRSKEDTVFDKEFLRDVFEAGNPQKAELLQSSMLVAYQLSMSFYQVGFQGLQYIPWRSRLAIWVAGVLYREIGVKVVNDLAKALQTRVFTSFWEKLWIVIRRSLVPPKSTPLALR